MKSTWIVVAALGCLSAGDALPVLANDLPAPALVRQSRLPQGPASWMSLHGDRAIFGAGDAAWLGEVGPTLRIRENLSLARPASGAVLVEDRLYTVERAGLHVQRLAEPGSSGLRIPLEPEPHGRVSLARMDDFLVVAEEGVGLRWLEMVFHDHAEHGPVPPDRVRPASILDLAVRFSAVGSSFRKVFVGTEAGHLLTIDAHDPARPLLVDDVDLGRRLDALAARGDTLFALGEGRLLVVEPTGEIGHRVVAERPAPGARALAVAGRAIYVAGDDGLTAYRDASAVAATIPVTVGSNFFQPSTVAANTGDTVVWQKQNLGLHNVESCDGVGTDPAVCAGTVSPDGSWTSGPPTSDNFIFQHTFVNAGSHRYFCAVHHSLGMTGVVTAAAAAPQPPTVPDGKAGLPLRVGKNGPAADVLVIEYDDSTCSGTPDHHLLYGGGQTLPADLGGTYGLIGSACDVGVSSPFLWASPNSSVDPGGLIWFLLVADDDVDTEGGWGPHSGNAERVGPAPGGHSGLCGMAAKDLTNGCGR